MALDGTTLPTTIEAVVHGCGEYFPRKDEGDAFGKDGVEADENRRVEIFCFDDEIQPPVPGKKGSKTSPYPQWNAQVTQDVDVERPFDVVIAVERDLAESPDYMEQVRLRSVDGSFERKLSIADSDVKQVGKTPLFEFKFRDVPEGQYDVAVDYGGDWVTVMRKVTLGAPTTAVADDGTRLGAPNDRPGRPLEESTSVNHCVR
jgi:hypothetical protein